jgi:hypothetical protein
MDGGSTGSRREEGESTLVSKMEKRGRENFSIEKDALDEQEGTCILLAG